MLFFPILHIRATAPAAQCPSLKKTVVYFSGLNAPYPCPADGIAMASAGQGTLRVEKIPDDVLGVAVIRSKVSGAGFRYTVAASWIPKLGQINKEQDPMGRYNAVMNAADLFTVEPLPAADSPAK